MAKPEPGRDPQMAERTLKLNVLFALTSIGLLLALSYMVWVDYDREWKKYQIAFNQIEVKVTKAQEQQVKEKVGEDKVKAIEDQLKRGQQEIDARRAEVSKAEKEAYRVHNQWYGIDQEYRFTKALIDVKRYEYEEAHHNHAGNEPKKQAELGELEKKFARLRNDLDTVKAREAAANDALKALEKTKLEAEAKEKEQLGDLTRLEDKLAKIQHNWVYYVRNLPILDMANPSLKINQIMPANLFDDVIFTATPKVDRCTTCHLAIDKKGYEDQPQPFKTHPELDLYLRGGHPMEKIGCTACHQGRGRATGFVNAIHIPGDKKQEKEWGRYSHSDEYHALHYWDQPMTAAGHTESQCLKCHQGMVEVPRADKLNTGVQLVERYGCFGCHKIKGWENLRKVGPDLGKVASKTSEEWILRWVQQPRAFRPTRMPQIWGVRTEDQEKPLAKRNDTEIAAAVAYVMDKSGHDTYPEPPKGDLAAGRKLFESVGCLACHRVGDDKRGVEGIEMASSRTHGPNLDGTGSKLSAGWLYAWIRNPKAYWHETKMPNLRLTEKEAADITAYLMSLKNDEFMARPKPGLDKGIRDAVLLKEYIEPLTTVDDARKKLDAMDDRTRTLFLGEKTIGRYGCFGCHSIAGFEKTSPIGVELTEEGSKLVERLDFGFLEHEIPHTLPGWVKQKLLDPRIYDRGKPSKKPDELLRMPNFHFADEEVEAIVTAILSFTKEQIPLAAQKQLSADEKYAEQGRRLVRNLNCQGCHVVGKGGAIRKVIESQLEASGGDVIQAQALSPPMLWNESSKVGEGARVQTDWLHGFLKDPSNKIRPWLQVRMPTFDFSEEEINTITRYFAAQDKVAYPYEPKPAPDAAMIASGKMLFDQGHFQCVRCHVVAGKLPNQEPANMAPDLANVPKRLRADWLALWLADPGKVMPGTRMPANFPIDPKENAYPEILGGDQKKQIEAVRAYLLTLGAGGGGAGQ